VARFSSRRSPALSGRVLHAWLVHLYTASSALCAFLAIDLVIQQRYREGFFWLFVAAVVDASDGVLARAVNVSERLPWFDGGRLDDIVDYLTYVFVPAFIAWHAALVPPGWGLLVPFAMLLSSLYGFSREDAKTADHFFTGFPSYWNIVVFYLYLAGWPPLVNAALLLLLAILVFVPLRYVYPSRTPVMRIPTIALGILWGLLLIVMLWRMPAIPRFLFWMSMIFPVYYAVLSFVLDRRRRSVLGRRVARGRG
jgi:phosphatidylcholine synthase